MRFYLKYLVFLSFAFVITAQADVSTEHVDAMLKQMVKENIISEREAQKARIKMLNMNPAQWSQINRQAMHNTNRAPASVSSEAMPGIQNVDLDGEQFKTIQNDLRKIVPQYKH